MNIVEQLEKLSRERSENSPFDSLEEFETWADAVRPLLSFNKKYSTEFSQAIVNASALSRMNSPKDVTTNMNNAVGIVNQAIILAKLELAEKKQDLRKNENLETKSKSIKERFENHPVVFGGSLLLAGLLAGISFMKFVFPSENQKTVTPRSISFECKIDGLPLLTESHDKRVSSMQNKILEFEAQASDKTLIRSYQDKYLESANRVRTDIEIENSLFNKSIERLLSKCKEIDNK